MTNTGFESHLVYGVRRDNTKASVSIIVDVAVGSYDAHAVAAKIAGPDYSFHASQNLLRPVPDDAKNILFHSDEELYVKAPALRPGRRKRSRR
jgi:hypothetical protein